MKLLFIFTGGTIGSTLNNGFISTDQKKSYKLLELYRKQYASDFEYDVTEPYIELSENNTGNTVKALCRCVLENVGRSYDGIIITHGTDTLQYSACALSYVLGLNSVPVCLVSSNYPVEYPKSNGLINLHGAVEFIMGQNPRGVWVSYKNPGEDLRIHRASRLASGMAYSDRMNSVYDSFFGYFDQEMIFHKNPRYSEKEDELKPLSPDGLCEFCESVLRIVPYPGMKYPKPDSDIKYIVHDSFHSGTINSRQSDIRDFLAYCRQNRISVFLTGIYGGASYESTKIYDNSFLYPVMNIAPISVFMKVWLALASGVLPESMIGKSLGGDVFSTETDA